MSGLHLGKFLMFTSVGSTAVAEFFMGGKGHLKRIVDREPVVAFSLLLGGIGFAAPQLIPPLRKSMGYDTSQYYGRPGKAPMSMSEVSIVWGGGVWWEKSGTMAIDEERWKTVSARQLILFWNRILLYCCWYCCCLFRRNK